MDLPNDLSTACCHANIKYMAKKKIKKTTSSSPKKSINSLMKKISNIKMFITDVDGVLTDGTIWLDSAGKWKRAFCVKDGVGLKLLMKAGYEVGVITGGKSEDVDTRIGFLGIKHYYSEASDKTPSFDKILKDTGLKPSEIAYIGDEVYDVPIIEKVGFGASVPDAVESVKAKAHYITNTRGGSGAVREICDLILEHGYHSRG